MPERLPDAAALAARLSQGEGRRVVAIVGAPGSGKSHVADVVADALNSGHPGRAVVLPMDGFHYDDGLLRDLGRLERKGAPDTFDAGGLAATLRRLRTGLEEAVAVPVFDRALEISRGAARLIPARAEIVLVEGNYLLLDRAPWDALDGLFDLTVMLDVPEEELARRLRARWQGFGRPEAEIRRQVETVDLPNGRIVATESRLPDLIVAN